MKNEHIKNIDLIESYLLGHLDVDEVQDFNERIRTDGDFNRLFREEEKIFLALSDQKALHFMKTVSGVLNESVKDKPHSLFRRFAPYTAIAASLILVIASILLLRQSDDVDTLFADLFEVYPMVQSIRSVVESNELVIAYESEDWNKVINLLSAESESSLPKEMTDVYKAISHLNLDQPSPAIDILSNYEKNHSELLYQDLIDWYLALSYLKSGDRHKCSIVLEKIISRSDKDSAIYSKAIGLSDRL